MDLGEFFLLVIILFAVIYFAVRLAINPLLYRQEESNTYNQESDLVKLRDMDVLNNVELEEVIELYRNKSEKKDGYEKYFRILNELKEIEYFTDEQTGIKIDKLNKYFKID